MKNILVCLHGWGGSSESFTELREALQKDDIEILTPDLPGFGKEPEPDRPWTNEDYADWVERWIESRIRNQESGVFLLGHSHGGRIAIKLAHRQTRNLAVTHLFLCASAGIKHPRHVKRVIGLTLAKSGKFFLSVPGLSSLAPIGRKMLYRLVRVHDYEQASPVMRETLINVTREDLRPLLPKITILTDLFWGTADHMTPYSDALIMRKEIPHAILHTYKDIRHRVHRDKAKEIATVIRDRMRNG